MPIRSREGNWHYRFQVDGHEYTGNTGLAATERNKSAALREEAKARELVVGGRSQELKLEVRPFNEAAKQFLAWADGEYREHPASAKRLHTSFASLVEFFKKRPVSSITPGLVEDYKGWRRSAHEVKEVTLRHDLHALSPFFDYAKKHNWTRLNPVEEVEIPSDADAVRIHALSQQEEALYFAAAQSLSGRHTVRVKASSRSRSHDQEFDSDYSDLIDVATLMLQQGCRPEELMSLEKHAVDLAAGKMRIVKGKSKAARRTLRLTATSRDVLGRRIADDTSPRWVFASPRISGCHITKLNGAHDRVLEKCGLSFVIYDFRHRADFPVMPNFSADPAPAAL
jgi:integrase